MPTPKGSHLYVNVRPSEARRRLKGFGHGVRKVQGAGRNQAVVIHAATGQHLAELEAKFSDVGFAESENDLSSPIEDLWNLGPASAAWLREIGVTTIGELERIGAVVAYRLVKQQQPRASLNLLWALAAGLADRDWRDLTDEQKERLRRHFEDDFD
jgi:hypothetical protein